MKPENWQPISNRYVAILDIMGFKDRVFRNSHDDIQKFMEIIGSTVSKIEELATGEDPIDVRPVFFSDSILLVSRNDSESSLEYLIMTCEILFEKCIEIHIPIKGAIAYGMQTADFDKSLHFGKPLIDAYLLQNELFFYGFVLHHSAQLKYNEFFANKNSNLCVIYDTPFKKVGRIKHFVVNLPSIDASFLLKNVNNIYFNVSGEPRKYVDNTIEFLNWIKPKT